MNFKKQLLACPSWWQLGALIHFAATFFWDKLIFRTDTYGFALEILDGTVSLEAERMIHQLYARGFSLILIVGVWYLLHRLVRGDFSKKEVLTFCGIFLGFSLVHLFYFPESFSTFGSDNSMTYSYAIRNIPFYWHGALTSIYYAACFYLFPIPLTVQEVSIAAFSVLVSFCMWRIRGGKLFVVMLALMPETWNVVTNPYRTDMYGLILLWATALVIYQWQQNGSSKGPLALLFLFFLAFTAVWRTEGIVLGAGLLLIWIFQDQNRQISWRKAAKAVAIFLVCLVVLSFPQKVGEKKYHGKDYLIITTASWLQPVINDANLNLDYPGGQEDLQTIDQMIPLDWIRELGSASFNHANESRGTSIIQSGFSEEAQSAYVSAAIRLILHNIRPFVVGRINQFLLSNGSQAQLPMGSYQGEPNQLPADTYEECVQLWNQGLEELYHQNLFASWSQSQFRLRVREVLETVNGIWSDQIKLNFTVYLLTGFFLLWWLVCQVRSLVQGNRQLRKDWPLALLLFIGLGEVGAVALGSPTISVTYYHPVYFFLSFLLCCSLGKWWEDRQNSRRVL